MRFDVAASFDVIVIGSGISGLLCALEIAQSGKTVSLLTKEAVTESSSLYAQGGIAVPLSEGDTVDEHIFDTLAAGAGLCDVDVTKEIISYSRIALEKLISYGVVFDSNAKNIIQQTKEAAHSKARVCHVGGDASGRFITKILIDKASRHPNVSISQGSIVLKILLSEGVGVGANACGVLVEDLTHSKYVLFGKDIIVATGGLGQLFENTTNPPVACGDGIGMAYQVGALLTDLEMIQFHPTVLFKNGNPVLITEAIRGEGGRLKNTNNEYFAKKYHDLADLAPRDILARAILNEIKKTKSKYVYLDVSNFSVDYFKGRFPTVYKTCVEREIDLFNIGIPVAPAVHYFIGGIKTDIYGRTNIPSLWALGEAASNGFHGANRLASNSLLECIVAPHYLAKSLLSSKLKSHPEVNYIDVDVDQKHYTDEEIKEITDELKSRNSASLGLIRNEKRMSEHLNWLSGLEGKEKEKINLSLISPDYKAQEFKNMILLSKLICKAALNRKNSLGVHFREDFPEKPSVLEHSVSKLDLKPAQLVSFS